MGFASKKVPKVTFDVLVNCVPVFDSVSCSILLGVLQCYIDRGMP